MKYQYLVFTDMDGTLLDHHTYSHAEADGMLAQLSEAKIPVIPTTSKTFEELNALRKEIGLTGPFIVENGAAIHIPHGFFKQKPANTQWINGYWVRQFCSKKQYWLSLLKRVEKDFGGLFTHFSAMSTEEIVDATGLTFAEAQRAANRQYGEPVLWKSDEKSKQQFIQALFAIGARPLQGGRFIHVSGDCNKGSALEWFIAEHVRQNPETTCKSIALGDGQNDVAMLEAADYAVRILSPVNEPPVLNKTQNVITSTKTGPAGWTESLIQIFKNTF